MLEPLHVYCDEASDEILAESWLVGATGLGAPIIGRLPGRALAGPALQPLLLWERQDWIVTRGEDLLCAVEFSRHGYTGDNGFQRFARLYRAAQLGIPCIYFTPFSRTRLNELDQGVVHARNVAPELFQTLEILSERFQVPCLAVAWPTDDEGTPLPLNVPAAAPSLATLTRLVVHLATNGNPGANATLRAAFPEVVDPMLAQGALAFRGSETRGSVTLPIDLLGRDWIDTFLPPTYFQYGKADKALASLSFNAVARRELQAPATYRFWESPGQARVLFLGYQWRPDPSAGLIALTAAQQREGERLVVVWPRVYIANGPLRQSAMNALRTFKAVGNGPLLDELQRLAFSANSIQEFRARVSVDDNQFGIFTPLSKPGRILSDTKALLLLGDGAILYE